MIFIGCHSASRGYYADVLRFERDGTPLAPAMQKRLAAELDRAETEIARYRVAIATSATAKPAKPPKRTKKKAAAR